MPLLRVKRYPRAGPSWPTAPRHTVLLPLSLCTAGWPPLAMRDAAAVPFPGTQTAERLLLFPGAGKLWQLFRQFPTGRALSSGTFVPKRSKARARCPHGWLRAWGTPSPPTRGIGDGGCPHSPAPLDSPGESRPSQQQALEAADPTGQEAVAWQRRTGIPWGFIDEAGVERKGSRYQSRCVGICPVADTSFPKQRRSVNLVPVHVHGWEWN